MACTDIFWHEFYKGAGVTLGLLLPLILGFGAVMWAVFRQLHRHEEAMQEARMRESQVRESHYRVIQGGQG
jgi:type IV secretory pathway TrbD component